MERRVEDCGRVSSVRILLPVTDEADARTTAEALEPYRPKRVTALQVEENGKGVPDKTTIEQPEEPAAAAYAAVRSVFPDARNYIASARDVVEATFEAVDGVDAGAVAVAFRSRGGTRLARFLSGNRSLKRVARAARPVVALPLRGQHR